jgi:hypothetical protein
MLSEFMRQHKIITTIIAILLVGLIAYTVYLSISRAGKEPVTIYLIPGDTKLTIDNQQYRAGTAYIKPGTYNVSASREGFESLERTVTIDQPNTTVIDISLTPVSDEAKQWQQDNMDLYKEFQVRTGIRANEFGEQFREQFPIVTKIPFSNFIYTIGYRLKNPDNASEGITIEITAITGYREAALDKIREFGFDPTDYEINFNNFENPFSHE